MQMPCSHCGPTRDFAIMERRESVTIKGRDVSFLAHYSRCPTCGEEMEAPDQLDANLRAAGDAYKDQFRLQSGRT